MASDRATFAKLLAASSKEATVSMAKPAPPPVVVNDAAAAAVTWQPGSATATAAAAAAALSPDPTHNMTDDMIEPGPRLPIFDCGSPDLAAVDRSPSCPAFTGQRPRPINREGSDGSQRADSDLGTKPPSLDGKSFTSGTTFGMDEKESLRPDDSASVKAAAADDDDSFSIRSSLIASRMSSDLAARVRNIQLGDAIFPPDRRPPLNNKNSSSSNNVGAAVAAASAPGPGPAAAAPGPTVPANNSYSDNSSNGNNGNGINGNNTGGHEGGGGGGAILPPGVITPMSASSELQLLQPAGRAVPIMTAADTLGMAYRQTPDEKLLDAMGTPRDRLFLLRLESQLISFVQNSKDPYMDVREGPDKPLNAFYRMLAHKLADYYHMTHSYEPQFEAVRIFRTPFCRVPTSLANVLAESLTENTVTPPPIVLPRKIMRRGEDAEPGMQNSSPSKSASEADSEAKENKDAQNNAKPTRSEREEAYKLARERIFGNSAEAEADAADNGPSRTGSASNREARGNNGRRGRGRRRDSDGFESRHQFTSYYLAPTQPQAWNQAPAGPYMPPQLGPYGTPIQPGYGPMPMGGHGHAYGHPHPLPHPNPGFGQQQNQPPQQPMQPGPYAAPPPYGLSQSMYPPQSGPPQQQMQQQMQQQQQQQQQMQHMQQMQQQPQYPTGQNGTSPMPVYGASPMTGAQTGYQLQQPPPIAVTPPYPSQLSQVPMPYPSQGQSQNSTPTTYPQNQSQRRRPGTAPSQPGMGVGVGVGLGMGMGMSTDMGMAMGPAMGPAMGVGPGAGIRMPYPYGQLPASVVSGDSRRQHPIPGSYNRTTSLNPKIQSFVPGGGMGQIPAPDSQPAQPLQPPQSPYPTPGSHHGSPRIPPTHHILLAGAGAGSGGWGTGCNGYQPGAGMPPPQYNGGGYGMIRQGSTGAMPPSFHAAVQTTMPPPPMPLPHAALQMQLPMAMQQQPTQHHMTQMEMPPPPMQKQQQQPFQKETMQQQPIQQQTTQQQQQQQQQLEQQQPKQTHPLPLPPPAQLSPQSQTPLPQPHASLPPQPPTLSPQQQRLARNTHLPSKPALPQGIAAAAGSQLLSYGTPASLPPKPITGP